MALRNLRGRLTTPDAVNGGLLTEVGDLTVNSDGSYSWVPGSEAENKGQTIVEVVGNEITLRMLHSKDHEDEIIGESTVPLTRSAGSQDAVDVTTSEAWWENSVINWLNELSDRTGIEYATTGARWNGNSELTPDATLDWDPVPSAPAVGNIYYANVTHTYARKLRGRVLWANSESDRSGIEYSGMFYDSGSYENNAYVRWKQSLGTEILPETETYYYIRLRFDLGPDPIDLVLHGTLFRNSVIVPTGSAISRVFLDIPPERDVTRTIALVRAAGSLTDNVANNTYAVIRLVRSSPTELTDYLDPDDYTPETFLQDPDVQSINPYAPERFNSDYYREFDSYAWINYVSITEGGGIRWIDSTKNPSLGDVYYVLIKLEDFLEELNDVVVNWANQFYDRSGVEYTAALDSTPWDGSGGDAIVQWVANSSVVITLSNIDAAELENWISSGSWTTPILHENDFRDREQTWLPSLGIVTTEGQSNSDTVRRSYSVSLDLSSQTRINFIAASNYAWSISSPRFRFKMHDVGGTTTSIDFGMSERNNWEYISLDISSVAAADKDAIDYIEFEVVDDTGNPLLAVDQIVTSNDDGSGNPMPEPEVLYYLNISYYDPSVANSKIQVKKWTGSKYEDLEGINLDRDGATLSVDQFGIDVETSELFLGDPIDNLTLNEHLIVEYEVNTEDTYPVSFQVPAYAEIASNHRIEFLQTVIHPYIEIFDDSLQSFVDNIDSASIQLLPSAPNNGDILYLGADNKFNNILLILSQVAVWDGAVTLTWEFWNEQTGTWDSFAPSSDYTSDFTDDSNGLIKLGMSLVQWNKWGLTQPHLSTASPPLNQEVYTAASAYWIRVYSNVSTVVGDEPIASEVQINPYEQYWNMGFKKITSIEPGSSYGMAHDMLKIYKPRSNLMKLFNVSADQLDVSRSVMFQTRPMDINRAFGETLDTWGVDYKLGRLPNEVDDEYRDRIKLERKLTASTVPSIKDYIAAVLDIDLVDIEIVQWWSAGWVLNTRVMLSSKTRTVTQEIIHSGVGGDYTKDPVLDVVTPDDPNLYDHPYILRWLTNKIGIEFNWVNTEEDGFGFDLSSYRPRWIFGTLPTPTREIQWQTEPDEQHPLDASVDLLPHGNPFYVNYTYFEIAFLPVIDPPVPVEASPEYLDFLNNLPGDELQILDDKPPTPGWWALISLDKSNVSPDNPSEGTLILTGGSWSGLTGFNQGTESLLFPKINAFVDATYFEVTGAHTGSDRIIYTLAGDEDWSGENFLSFYYRSDIESSLFDLQIKIGGTWYDVSTEKLISIPAGSTTPTEAQRNVWLRGLIPLTYTPITAVQAIGFKVTTGGTIDGGVPGNPEDKLWIYDLRRIKLARVENGGFISQSFVFEEARLIGLTFVMERTPSAYVPIDPLETQTNVGWISSDPINTVVTVLGSEDNPRPSKVLQITTTSSNSIDDTVYTTEFVNSIDITDTPYFNFMIYAEFSAALQKDRLLLLRVWGDGYYEDYPIIIDKVTTWEAQRIEIVAAPNFLANVTKIEFVILEDQNSPYYLIDNIYFDNDTTVTIEVKNDEAGLPGSITYLTKNLSVRNLPFEVAELIDVLINSEDSSAPYITVPFAPGETYHVVMTCLSPSGVVFYYDEDDTDLLAIRYYFAKRTTHELIGAYLDDGHDGEYAELDAPLARRRTVNFYSDVFYVFKS